MGQGWVLLFLCFPAVAVGAAFYERADAAFRQGLYAEALDLYIHSQAERGAYLDTHARIADCVTALRREKEQAARGAAVERARGMLALRGTALRQLLALGQGAVEEDGVTLRFRAPVDAFQEESSGDWAALCAYAATIPRAFVGLAMETNPATPRRDQIRPGLLLAERLLRDGGVPPDRLFLAERPGEAGFLHVLLAPQAPRFAPGETPIAGALLRPERPQMQGGEDLPIDLVIFHPSLAKSWSLSISDGQGAVLRRYGGSPALFQRVVWDGKKTDGAPAPAGEYRLEFHAAAWTGESAEDAAGLRIVAPASRAPPGPAPRAPPQRRQHRLVVRFTPHTTEPLAQDQDAVAQLAYLLAINPEHNVLLTGSAEGEDPRLAQARAEFVRSALLRLGVAAARIALGPPAGGSASVVVVFQE